MFDHRRSAVHPGPVVDAAGSSSSNGEAAGGTVFDDGAEQHDHVVDGPAIDAALDRGEIVAWLQPIVDTSTRSVPKFESLARWVRNNVPIATPDEFIPVAEATGRIAAIDLTMLASGCSAITEMSRSSRSTLTDDVALSANLSPLTLSTPFAAGAVLDVIERSGLPFERVWIEITESSDIDRIALQAIHELVGNGIRIAVDDFGTRYASLANVDRLPLSGIKIDRSFVERVAAPTGRATIRTIVALARELRLEVVAEGVEHAADEIALRRLGVDVQQGFRHGVPQPPSEFGRASRARRQRAPRVVVAATPPDELTRIEVLHAMHILDQPDDAVLRGLVEAARTAMSTPIALISLVDRDRLWFAATCGLDARETSRDVGFCSHAILSTAPLVVPDALADRRFARNPLVLGAPWIRSYAGVPLVVGSGHALGTLCAVGTDPQEFETDQLEVLRLLATLVTRRLEQLAVSRQPTAR